MIIFCTSFDYIFKRILMAWSNILIALNARVKCTYIIKKLFVRQCSSYNVLYILPHPTMPTSIVPSSSLWISLHQFLLKASNKINQNQSNQPMQKARDKIAMNNDYQNRELIAGFWTAFGHCPGMLFPPYKTHVFQC